MTPPSEARKGKAEQERDFGQMCPCCSHFTMPGFTFGFDSLEKLTRTEVVVGWTLRFFFEGLVRKGADTSEWRI